MRRADGKISRLMVTGYITTIAGVATTVLAYFDEVLPKWAIGIILFVLGVIIQVFRADTTQPLANRVPDE